MSNITWTEASKGNHVGTINDVGCFDIIRLPSRHYDLYQTDGTTGNQTKVLSRTSLAKCKAKAEELLAPVGDMEDSVITWTEAPAPDSPEAPKTIAQAASTLIGEIISWSPGKGTRTYKEITEALATADLDPGVAKELLPRYAFARACKELEVGRIIEKAPQHDLGDVLAYQFVTKQQVTATDYTTGKDYLEWAYDTEAILHVDKDKGKVWCKDPALMTKAQELLDSKIEARTAGDVTRIIQRLFAKNADLFPVRDHGGCYLVPAAHLSFVAKVDAFLKAMGGKVRRFPVSDPNGGVPASVQDTIAEGLALVIKEHKDCVDGFGLTTHAATLEASAKQIAETRVKIEAYASMLEGYKNELLASIDEANKELIERVNAITNEKTEWAEPTVTMSFKKAS